MPQGHEDFIAALCRCLEAVEGETEKVDVRREGGRGGGGEGEIVETYLRREEGTEMAGEKSWHGKGKEKEREGRVGGRRDNQVSTLLFIFKHRCTPLCKGCGIGSLPTSTPRP